jgi:hypothetical protein
MALAGQPFVPLKSRRMTQPTLDQIMELGLGFWASKALLSAIEIGVCNGKQAKEILREIPTQIERKQS